jgi:L-fuculose-phosphate aldolase
MHLACYAARADVQAVVHAHPPVATGFATAGQGIPADVLPEIPVVVGPVALVPYGRPGTPALAAAMVPYLATHEVFLLANHGVTTVGRSLTDALLRLESVEQAARILAVARLLGGERRLPPGEAAALASLHPLGELAGQQSATRTS